MRCFVRRPLIFGGKLPIPLVQCAFRFQSFQTKTLSTPRTNHYQRLKIQYDATSEEIKAAYRNRALECHPDVVEEDRKAAAEVEFRSISEAFQVLHDPAKRCAYDSTIGVDTKVVKENNRAAAEKGNTRKAASMRKKKTEEKRRRESFVRRDADRTFHEAFDGKTLDEILFEERRRLMRKKKTKNAEGKESDGPAGRDETLRRVMVDSARRYSEEIRRQYGPSITKYVQAKIRTSSKPVPPPSSHMPFRPFIGMNVPEGVSTPSIPSLGPIAHILDENVINKTAPKMDEDTKKCTKFFVRKQYEDGSPVTQGEAMQSLDQERNMPYNLGQLYSYQRPY